MLRAIHQGNGTRYAHQSVPENLSISLRWERMVWPDCRAASRGAGSTDTRNALHARQANDGESFEHPTQITDSLYYSLLYNNSRIISERSSYSRADSSQAKRPCCTKYAFPSTIFHPSCCSFRPTIRLSVSDREVYSSIFVMGQL